MTDRRELRSTWRTLPVVARADDRFANWLAFAPLLAVAAWLVALSSAVILSAGAFAALLYVLDTAFALEDRRRLGRRFDRLPSVLWCFATPFVYLPLRKRALDRQRVGDSWLPLAIHSGCLGAILAVCLVWAVLKAMTFGI